MPVVRKNPTTAPLSSTLLTSPDRLEPRWPDGGPVGLPELWPYGPHNYLRLFEASDDHSYPLETASEAAGAQSHATG